MADMQREIDLCIELIEDALGQEYDADEDTKTLITEIPEKILQRSFVALRAQSESGTHYVDMRRPDIKRVFSCAWQRMVQPAWSHMMVLSMGLLWKTCRGSRRLCRH
ncbi:hypothetical protein HL42_3579 [Trichophyton rubrum]|nr:hypothetical protein HL42_3579 [Trichophyton rubrum]